MSTTKVDGPLHKDKLKFHGRTGHLENPEAFERLIKKMETCYWNVNDRPVEPDNEHETLQEAAERVVAYLARYVRRVAISNVRLISLENGMVRFWYKDRRDGNKQKIAEVPALEFIDRFLSHVLPRGKRHVRNYGYLAAGNRKESLKLLGELFQMNTAAEETEKPESGDEPTKEKEELPEHVCPCCERGELVIVRTVPRPTVHELMQMTLEELRQPRLPFW